MKGNFFKLIFFSSPPTFLKKLPFGLHKLLRPALNSSVSLGLELDLFLSLSNQFFQNVQHSKSYPNVISVHR